MQEASKDSPRTLNHYYFNLMVFYVDWLVFGRC